MQLDFVTPCASIFEAGEYWSLILSSYFEQDAMVAGGEFESMGSKCPITVGAGTKHSILNNLQGTISGFA